MKYAAEFHVAYLHFDTMGFCVVDLFLYPYGTKIVETRHVASCPNRSNAAHNNARYGDATCRVSTDSRIQLAKTKNP
jgi:hypothetical protein